MKMARYDIENRMRQKLRPGEPTPTGNWFVVETATGLDVAGPLGSEREARAAAARIAKKALEREAFVDFAAIAELPVVPGSVGSRPEPEPDILCEIEGRGHVAFELVNLADEDLERGVARSLRYPDSPEPTFHGDPTLLLIRRKLFEKAYVTEHPMELLAYGGDPLSPKDVWMPTNAQRVRDLFHDAAASRRSDGQRTFQRLWVVNFGRRNSRGVWLVHPTEPTA